MHRAPCSHGAPARTGARGGACLRLGSRRTLGGGFVSAAEQKIVRGPSAALGSTAPDKVNFPPRSAQDDGILKSGLRRPPPSVRRLPSRSGFTLLEMIIVLVIIALLAAMTVPGFNSAVNEHRVREDGHQLAMMVREGMIQSAEQHRVVVMDLTKNTMKLYAQGEEAKADTDANADLFKDSGSTQTNADMPIADTMTQATIDQEQTLDSPNALMVPDPNKADGWLKMPDEGVEWVFQPGELCPAAKIRVVRGDAYLEMDFDALTGNVNTEKFYFP